MSSDPHPFDPYNDLPLALGDEGVKTLAQDPNLGRKTDLDLSRTKFGDEGAKALAASPYLQKLRSLNLSRNFVGDEGVKALAASPYLQNLQVLFLGYDGEENPQEGRRGPMGDEGALALAGGELKNLVLLDIPVHVIGKKGIYALASSPFLPNLQSLTLGQKELVEEALGDVEGLGDLVGDREILFPLPSITFAKEEVTPVWRLWGYSRLPPQKQTELTDAFLSVALQIRTLDAEGIGWAWCQRHMSAWSGERLRLASRSFPESSVLRARVAFFDASESALF